MDYSQNKMDCMAGIVISKQQNNKNTKLKTGSQQQETANLNITLCTKPANICCCLCLQQASVVATNTNNKLMKSNLTTTNTCCWHNLACKVDDRILTNYNCNIKSVQQKKHQQQQKRPLTLSIAVIIMSLSILLIQMPTMTASKAIFDERFSASSSSSSSALELSADYISEESETAETSMELKAELIDLLQREREIVALLDDETQSSSSSSDQLSSLDVIKHMQRTEEHQKERRKNLRKRHTNELIIKKYLEENDNNMEWVNPCNVYRVMPGMRTVSKYEKFQYYEILTNKVRSEYEKLNYTTPEISLSDMDKWQTVAKSYTFLPKLNGKRNNVSLSNWYRHLQYYVGSFGYLARSQYKYDKKSQQLSEISKDLNTLLQSARAILCDVENTINGSAPNNNIKKLRTIRRNDMNAYLKFKTKQYQINNPDKEPLMEDLKIAKYFYLQYLNRMEKILNHKLEVMSKKYDFKRKSQTDTNVSDIIVGDISINLDDTFNSDWSESLSESLEKHFKSTTKKPANKRTNTRKPNTQRNRRTKKITQ